jgi:predicted nucleotidyltransferase
MWKKIQMVSTKAEVLQLLDKNKAKLTKFGVRKFSLFGSFLFDQVSDKSDVDLLVEFEPDQKTFTNFTNLVFFLEELLGRSVEIVTTESLSPYIGPHILREAEDVTIST